MSEHHDPLSQLWQKQDVEQINIEATKKTWRAMQIKQKLYAFLDLLGIIIPALFLYFYADGIDTYSLIFFVVYTMLVCPFIIYLLWLRRFSIGWSSNNIEQHVEYLKSQIKNNIKIAFLTKHSCWVTLIVMLLYLFGLYYMEVFELDRLIRKSLVLTLILIVLLPGLWIWAARRELRFKRELVKLEGLFAR